MAKVKVVQCWDDGVINDIRLAELLRKYNAKATFNLCPGLMKENERIPDGWVAKGQCGGHYGYISGKLSLKDIPEIYDGFELASHCWLHENVNNVSTADFVKSAVDARNFLEDTVQRSCTGFAWPYGAYTAEACAGLRDAGFSYGRTTVNVEYATQCDDTMALHSNCHFMNRDFYKIYEKAKECGVFYFWGHSYEMLEYDRHWEQFEMKLQYISEDPDAEWANVVDIVPLCKK
jgi:peptidoglycan/xylan/chitin deacetylase (PgdA/CDA1 family)